MYYINVTWLGGIRETLDKRRTAKAAIEVRQELMNAYQGLHQKMMIETRPVEYEAIDNQLQEKVYNDETDYFGIDRPGF